MSEMVPCIQKLLVMMNSLLKGHPHCKEYDHVIGGNFQMELNHVEVKIFIGKDLVTKENVDFYDAHQKLQPTKESRPMSLVDYHCDFLVGQKNNSQQKDSLVLSMSIGEPRRVTYKRQWIKSGDQKFCDVPLEKKGEHRFFHRLDHGSLNVLDPRDESGEGDMRFQHKADLVQNRQTRTTGNGISAVLVHFCLLHSECWDLLLHRVGRPPNRFGGSEWPIPVEFCFDSDKAGRPDCLLVPVKQS